MPHIHTEENQHDFTASAHIIRLDLGDEPRLMLHMHRKVHMLLQAGGHVELEENPWQSIRHELVEETGYRLDDLKLLQPKIRMKSLKTAVLHPTPVCINTHSYQKGLDHKHIDTIYAFVASGAPTEQPLEGESQDIRWVTLAELKAFKPETEVSTIAQQVGEFILTVLLEEWELVDPKEYKFTL